jgi:hypothetical protein
MGSKLSNRRNLNEMKMLTELVRLKVIDPIRRFRKNSKFFPVSEGLLEFIQKRKISSLKEFFRILLKIIEVIQTILEIRKKYEFKLFLVNFDYFYFDPVKNSLIYEDIDSLSKNFEFSFFLTDHFVKRSKKVSEKLYYNGNKKSYSIQPYLYTEIVNDKYLKEFKKKKEINENDCEFYYKQSQIFYSNLILNFLRNAFKTAFIVSSDSNVIEKIFCEFRTEVLSKLKIATVSRNMTKIKKLLDSIVKESYSLKEIISYYEFFGNRCSLSINSASEFSENSKKILKFSTNSNEAKKEEKFRIIEKSSHEDISHSLINHDLTIVNQAFF